MKFNLAAGIKAVHVPPGPTDAIADVIAGTIAGRTAYMMAPISLALPQIRDGKLVALGVTTARRSSLLPEVPTIAEAGVAGFDLPDLVWDMGARGHSGPVMVDKLSKDIGARSPCRSCATGSRSTEAEPMSMTQPEFARFVLGESESAAQIIKAAGIKVQ